MATNYKHQKYNEYMDQLRKGKIITVYYDELDELEQRCKAHKIKIHIRCNRENVSIWRRK